MTIQRVFMAAFVGLSALCASTAANAQSNFDRLMEADKHLVKGTEALKRSGGTDCRNLQIAYDELGLALDTAQSIDYVSGDENERKIWDAKMLMVKKLIPVRKDVYDRLSKYCD